MNGPKNNFYCLWGSNTKYRQSKFTKFYGAHICMSHTNSIDPLSSNSYNFIFSYKKLHVSRNYPDVQSKCVISGHYRRLLGGSQSFISTSFVRRTSQTGKTKFVRASGRMRGRPGYRKKGDGPIIAFVAIFVLMAVSIVFKYENNKTNF